MQLQHRGEAGKAALSFALHDPATDGQIDKQIEIVKQLDIKGKTVSVPNALRVHPEANAKPDPDGKETKKVKRETRRKAREEAKSNGQKRAVK